MQFHSFGMISNMNMPVSELFGFLNHPDIIEFDGGKIIPTDSFRQGLEFINKFINQDGNFYPGLTRQYTQTLESDQKEFVPNSERPALVFQLPASHSIYIERPLNERNVRYEDAGLLIHLIGFLFETRLQFSDWRFDGKVPIKCKKYFSFSADVPSIFLSHVYQKWKTLDSKLRILYINILFMHGKAKSCDWQWDEFLYRYMVFDAIYNFATEGKKAVKIMQNGKSISVTHKLRFKYLCDNFGIHYDNEEQFEEIYDLRNDLFHEGLWDGWMPGLSLHNSNYPYRILKKLERHNSRLIVAISDYKQSSFWCFGLEPFDSR